MVMRLGVSILVFLEPLLRHCHLEIPPLSAEVSILVFLEPLLRHDIAHTPSVRAEMFQSLFFWNHYLDLSKRPDCHQGLHSFNPCFSGTTT